MGRKFITFLLIVLIIFIGRILFVSKKNIVFIGDMCTYNLPASEITKEFKNNYRKCQVSILLSMSTGRFNCSDIKKPACDPNENSTLLCQALIKKDPAKGPQDICEAEFNCPDDLKSYNDLIGRCANK